MDRDGYPTTYYHYHYHYYYYYYYYYHYRYYYRYYCYYVELRRRNIYFQRASISLSD